MNIVITMAGLGSRFKKAGYDIPKYMIEAHGKTLFTWSMLSLEGYKAQAKRYIFIVRKEDGAEAFIKAELRALGINNVQIIEIDYLTDGQATTALLAESVWDKGYPLMIYNIDTFVEPGQMNSAQLKGDGFIPCFKGEGDHWSFVRTSGDDKAVEVKEKVRISDHCTLGAYYFKSAGLYEDVYKKCFESGKPQEAAERYIAPMYNDMLKYGYDIYISDVDARAVHVLGTPEELEAFKAVNREDIRC